MRGLIYKDLVTLRKELLVLFGIIIFYAAIVLMNPDESRAVMYMGIIAAFLAILPATLCAYDDRKDWNTFICASPLSKQKIVGAKYILYIINVLAIFLFTAFSFWYLTQGVPISILLTTVSCAVIVAMIQLPINYKFGIERGRIIAMAMVFLPVILFLFLQQQGFISLESISGDLFSRLPYFTGPAAVVFTLLS